MRKHYHDKIRTENKILQIPQSDILPNPNQPRKRFDYDELEGLAQSIRTNGILQPLLVRPLENGKYELIAGERRLRAARLVGLTKVPCVVNEISETDSAVFAVLENLQRQDLDYFEEAEALATLISDYHMGQEELCRKLGKAQSTALLRVFIKILISLKPRNICFLGVSFLRSIWSIRVSLSFTFK